VSFINETDYASSLDYAGFAQLCGKSAIMRKIMRAHNRIIPRSLIDSTACIRDYANALQVTVDLARDRRSVVCHSGVEQRG